MTRNTIGTICCVLAVMFAVVAINNTFVSPEIPVGDESGLGVSRMMGAFLPAVLFLALGLYQFQKPKT